MRPSNKSRSRNKSGSSSHNSSRRSVGNVMNRVFDSAGPDGKVRGTPQQIIDKYQALARDAQLSGDRVAAESFLQHSEHYSRLLGEAQRQQQEQRQNQQEREAAQQQQRGQAQQEDSQQRGRAQENAQPRGPEESSGLTTIDTDDAGGESGPIETPEGGGKRAGDKPSAERSETAAAEEHVNGAAPAAGGASQEAAPAKRPRTRRKAKSEPASPATEATEAQAD